MAFRSPKDVQLLAGNFIGGNVWIDKSEYTKETRDKRKRAGALSAAEKVLAIAVSLPSTATIGVFLQ